MLVVGTSIFGLGVSGIFPTNMALVNEYLYMGGTGISIIMVNASLGAMTFPLLLGAVTTETTPFYFAIVCLAL